MEMNAIPQRYVFEIIDASGCLCLEAPEDGVLGTMPGVSQTFVIRKKGAH
jgi:hypothetical protein